MAKKSDPSKVPLEKYDVLEKIIECEIERANACYETLFRFVGKLFHKQALKKYGHPLINLLGQSVTSEWISSIAKIFDLKSGAYSLIRLVELTELYPDAQFSYRLERLPDSWKVKAEAARKKFKSEQAEIKRYILSKNVQGRVSELRDIFRQHNFPDRKTKYTTNHVDGDVLVKKACEIYILCLHASARKLYINVDDYKQSPILKNLNLGIREFLGSIS